MVDMNIRVLLIGIVLMLALTIVFYPVRSALGTWSIAAIDPATGDVGFAGATCLDSY